MNIKSLIGRSMAHPTAFAKAVVTGQLSGREMAWMEASLEREGSEGSRNLAYLLEMVRTGRLQTREGLKKAEEVIAHLAGQVIRFDDARAATELEIALQRPMGVRPNVLFAPRATISPNGAMTVAGGQGGTKISSRRSHPFADASRRLPLAHWNPKNHQQLLRWIDRLGDYRPESLCVTVDLDNTLWAGDLADDLLRFGSQSGDLNWKKANPLQNYPVRPGESPFDYYMRLYTDEDAVLAYNFAAQVFAHFSLQEVYDFQQRAMKSGLLPKAYQELVTLLNYLKAKGVAVAYVSASPIFAIAPMLEVLGFKTSLQNVEGIDPYVVAPGGGKPVKLSNLIQTAGYKSWKDVLTHLGNYKITSRVSEVGSYRKGKGVGVTSVIWRHVMRWNREQKGKKLSLEEMRLAAVIGDNFGSFSDLTGGDPLERGSDHGMFRALSWIPRALALNIGRLEPAGENGELALKDKYIQSFYPLMRQLSLLHSGTIEPMVQLAIAGGSQRGNFVPASLAKPRR